MSETPATRASQAPCAPQTPAPACGGPDGSADATAARAAPARARERAELVKAVLVAKWRRIAYPDAQPKEAPVTEPVRWNVCPDCLGRHKNGAACHDEPRTETVREEDIRHAAATTGHVAANAVTVETEDPDAARAALRERLAEALGMALANVAAGASATTDGPVPYTALADAVLPVVEEALATETASWEGVLEGMETRLAEYIGRAQQAEAALAEQAERLAYVEQELEHLGPMYVEAHNRATENRRRTEAAEAEVAQWRETVRTYAHNEGEQRKRAEQAERQRDEAIAALTHHAAEAHRRKWAHDDRGDVLAFRALGNLGDEILASRDRILAADQPKE